MGGGGGKAKGKNAFIPQSFIKVEKGAQSSNDDDEDGSGFSTHNKRKMALGLRHVGGERNVRGRCDGGWDSKLVTGRGKESVEKEMNPEGKSLRYHRPLAALRKHDERMLEGDDREVLMCIVNGVWC